MGCFGDCLNACNLTRRLRYALKSLLFLVEYGSGCRLHVSMLRRKSCRKRCQPQLCGLCRCSLEWACPAWDLSLLPRYRRTKQLLLLRSKLLNFHPQLNFDHWERMGPQRLVLQLRRNCELWLVGSAKICNGNKKLTLSNLGSSLSTPTNWAIVGCYTVEWLMNSDFIVVVYLRFAGSSRPTWKSRAAEA